MIELPLWAEIIASFFIVLSGILALVGAIGLLKFKNFKDRIHAPTLANSTAIFILMFTSAFISYFVEDRGFFHEVIVICFIFLTSPVTSMLLMRSYLFRIEKQYRS